MSNQKSKKKVGRPKKYNSVEEMQVKIDTYFSDCDERKAIYTIEGLCYWLDMERQSLLNYSKDEEFFDTIKRAKAKILARLQELASSGKHNATMAIFNLKNNYGYVDRSEVKNEHSGEIRRGMDSFYDNKESE